MPSRCAAVVMGVMLCAPLFAQHVSFGFTGGATITHDYPLYRSLYLNDSFPGGLTTSDLPVNFTAVTPAFRSSGTFSRTTAKFWL
mgnify:CR=1 FL=1